MRKAGVVPGLLLLEFLNDGEHFSNALKDAPKARSRLTPQFN